jgi:antitoxin YefM
MSPTTVRDRDTSEAQVAIPANFQLGLSQNRAQGHAKAAPSNTSAGFVLWERGSLTNFQVAKTVRFTDARTHLTELFDEIEWIHEHVVITRNGHPAAVVMSHAEYDFLLETLEVLSDNELMAALAESDEDIAAGRVIPWDEVKQELGLA